MEHDEIFNDIYERARSAFMTGEDAEKMKIRLRIAVQKRAERNGMNWAACYPDVCRKIQNLIDGGETNG